MLSRLRRLSELSLRSNSADDTAEVGDDPFDALPEELLPSIAQHLQPRIDEIYAIGGRRALGSLLALSRTCRRWRAVCVPASRSRRSWPSAWPLILRTVILDFQSPSDEKALLRRCKFLDTADDDTLAAIHTLVIGRLDHEDASTKMIDGATITRNQVRCTRTLSSSPPQRVINGVVERLAPQLRSIYALRLLLDPYVLATMARMPYLHSLDLDDHCQTYFGGLDDFVNALGPRPFATLKHLYISVPPRRSVVAAAVGSASTLVRYLGPAPAPLESLTIRGFRENFARWLPTPLWRTLRRLCLDAGSSRGQFPQLFAELAVRAVAYLAQLMMQTFRQTEVSPLEDIRLESRGLLPGDFEAIIASLKGHTRLRRLGVMELEEMEPGLIRLVGSTLPHLHHLDLIYGTDARRWPGREVRAL